MTLLPAVRDLRQDWDSRAVRRSSTTLEFSGTPPIAAGDLFVLQDQAFRVDAVSIAAGRTTVAVSVPDMDDVVDDIILDGTFNLADAEFVPAAGTTARPQKAAQPLRSQFSLEVRDGVKGIANSSSYGSPSGLKMKADTFVGGSYTPANYSVKGRSGSAKLDLVLEIDAQVFIAPGSGGDSTAVCPTSGSGGLRVHLGTLRMPTSLPTVFVEVPVCLFGEAEATVSLELLRFQGSWESTVTMASGVPSSSIAPRRKNPALTPVDNAIDASLGAPGNVEAALNAAGYVEAALQLKAFGLGRVGALVQAGASAEGTFTRGATFTAGTWDQAMADLELCLRAQLDWRARGFAFGKFLGIRTAKSAPIEFREKFGELAMGFGQGCGLEVEVDPAGTFLRVGSSDMQRSPVTLSLATLILPGVDNAVEMLYTGSYVYNPFGQTTSGVSALFRSGGGGITPDFSSAVGTQPVNTPSCGDDPNFQAGDVPGDFFVASSAPATRIRVPQGATTLAFSVPDCYFQDNAPAGGGIKVKVRGIRMAQP